MGRTERPPAARSPGEWLPLDPAAMQITHRIWNQFCRQPGADRRIGFAGTERATVGGYIVGCGLVD